MVSETTRAACLNAFLALVAEQGFERVTFAQIAVRAGVPLSQMRVGFASPFDFLPAFGKSIDLEVLAEGGLAEDMAGEGPHERLFEVLMRRLDALEPHRAAIVSLRNSARRNPALAAVLLKSNTQSQRWMLAAAGIDAAGLEGDVKAHGLALLFARVVDVWLKDEDPGLSRTMAALDRELRSGAKLLDMLDDLAYIALPWRSRRASASASVAVGEASEGA
ncbi:TetR/AcrR family transcriptional regulator [Aquabacter sp. L1I39]|uniref:TetR/AcrR family transcriptional regulator n=1 Tax=Aquabacter sp. L1I39 TaxID=2820278 RepID=UPI001ADCAF52|nr:TetR/AcrR family transcriptional regulator [Aquabacter sp. L1I39]QTL05824.1 TetR/AcrR family transcriptional regulator [Aquabacter sp. L1I39]